MEENDEKLPDEEAGALMREIAFVTLVVFVIVLAASIAAQFWAVVSQSLYLIVAVAFVYVPFWLLERKELSFREFGLATDRLWRNIAIGLGLLAVTAVPFAGGYYVWETYAVGDTYEFDWANFQKWSPNMQGQPTGWGGEPGVWVWTDERDVHVGMYTGKAGRVRANLRLDRPAVPSAVGPVEVRPAGVSPGATPDDGWEPARKWQLFLKPPHKRAEVTIQPRAPGTASYPTRVEVSMQSPTDAAALHVGPGGREVDGSQFALDRGLWWIVLWLLTQVAFIALPEEFFYRGYLQTRIRHALGARRREADDSEPSGGPTRSWLGISEENVLASAMFGLAHLLIPVGGRIIASRISVFFPALVFGWLRDRTGSITAPVVYHAGCNMLVLLAAPHFF